MKINDKVMIPSKDIKNAAEFFKLVKPPLFDDYEIVIDPGTKGLVCYNQAFRIAALAGALAFATITSLI